MPLVKSSFTAQKTAYEAEFPRLTSPSFVATDKIYETHPFNWGENEDFVPLPEAECVIPKPVKVWHNNIINGQTPVFGDASYPTITWTADPNSTAPIYTGFSPPQMFTELIQAVQPNDDNSNNVISYECPLSCSGFTFLLQRTDYVDTANAGNDDANKDDDDAPKFELIWGIGSGDDDQSYYLKTTTDSTIEIGKYDFVAKTETPIKTTDYVADTSVGLKGSYSTGQDYLLIDVMLMGGKLYIAVGSEGIPIMLPEARVGEDGNIVSEITGAQLIANNQANLRWSIHETKFKAVCSLTSTQISIGFRAQEDPGYEVLPAEGWQDLLDPNDYSITIGPDPNDTDDDSLLGPLVVYQLNYQGPADGTFKGDDYSDFPVGIRAVNLYWAAGPLVTGDAPITNPTPEAMRVFQRFILDSLTITSGAEMELNNWGGEIGAYAQNTGIEAIQIALGKYTFPEGTETQAPTSNNNIVFTGAVNRQASLQNATNSHTGTISCEDRMFYLRTPRWSLPWMDGWNSLYAVAYLCGLAGIDISWMAFEAYVPDNPYDDWGDPSGGGLVGAYFLPVGYMSTQLTRFSGQNIDEIISRIAQSIGYMNFFDRFSLFHFEKFNFPLILELGSLYPSKRSFFESDAESYYYTGDPTCGCESISWTKNMATVRNKVVIVGINAFSPAWAPIVVTLTDANSIDNPGVSNYIGGINPFVWADNIFADAGFAYNACYTSLLIFRIPETKMVLKTWFQPDIYPLDVIDVFSTRCCTWGPNAPVGASKFLVTDVEHAMDQHGQKGMTTISGLGIAQYDQFVNDFGGVVD